MATTRAKRAQTTGFGIPSGSLFIKFKFVPLVDAVEPFKHAPIWAGACSLLQPTGRVG